MPAALLPLVGVGWGPAATRVPSTCWGNRAAPLWRHGKSPGSTACPQQSRAPALEPRALTHTLPPTPRPLGLFLAESNLAHNERGKRGGKRRPGASKGAEEGWTSGSAARAAAAATAAAAVFRAANEAEQMELEALNRVGQRRRRRFANDLLLRQMAGARRGRQAGRGGCVCV